jgi:hypothetical protein
VGAQQWIKAKKTRSRHEKPCKWVAAVLGALAGLVARLFVLPYAHGLLPTLLCIAPFLLLGAWLMRRPATVKMAIDFNMTFLLMAQPAAPPAGDEWNRNGTIHLPVHHRRPWGPVVGGGQSTSGRRISIHRICGPRGLVSSPQALIRLQSRTKAAFKMVVIHCPGMR